MDNIKKYCIEYLLDQAENSTFIKEHATVNEYERFKKWITNLDYNKLEQIIEQDEEKKDIASKLSQGKSIPEKGKDVAGLAGTYAKLNIMTKVAMAKARLACEKKCTGIANTDDWKKCHAECMADRLQHMIGSLKTEKDKCTGSQKQRCYNMFDKAISKVATQVKSLMQ
jgi:hypothetical protein